MPSITYDIGYYGKVILDNVPILARDGSITLQHNPIYTNGFYGADVYGGAKNVCYAFDYPTLSTQVGFQLTTNGILDKIGEFASQERWKAKILTIYPNGVAGYKGDAYCEAISFQTSQDNLVTGNLDAKSAYFEDSFNNENADVLQSSLINQIAEGYLDVYPYYGTMIEIDDSKIKQLISWSISQNTQIVFEKTCSCEYQLNDVQADYVGFGMLTGSGSYSQVKLNNLKDHNDLRKIYGNTNDDQNTNAYNVVITMISSSNKETCQIKLHSITYTNESQSVQTGTSLIQCNYSFTIIGDGINPLLKFNIKQG